MSLTIRVAHFPLFMKPWTTLSRTYSRRNLINYEKGCEALSRFKDFYGPSTVIVEAYPGVGVWSKALNDTLKPKSHILLEPYIGMQKYLKEHVINDSTSMHLRSEDPFRWGTFTDLIAQGEIPDKIIPRTEIHSDILFTANLTHPQGEQLCVQYLNCISNQSWLQALGRVRLLLWVRQSTCTKVMARPSAKTRNRVSVQAESAAISTALIGDAHHLELFGKCDPPGAVISVNSNQDFYPNRAKDDPLCLLQLDPLQDQVDDIDEFEYVIRMLFITRNKPLQANLGMLGPGSLEDLGPKLSDILHIKPIDMTLSHFIRIAKAFHEWPFKPEMLHDFYDEHAAL